MHAKVIVVSDNAERAVRPRLKFPHHPQNITSFDDIEKIWDDIVFIEQTVDGGMEFDTVIVCNGGYSWWRKLQHTPTKNGRFVIFERPNTGGSFGGYNFAYKNTPYDGFLFTEEDILVFGPSYYKRIVERFNEEEAGFVCLVDYGRREEYPTHCHGGVGYTTRGKLKLIQDENKELPYYKVNGWHQRDVILEGEIPFTNRLVQHGEKLVLMKEHERAWRKENLCIPHALFNRAMVQ